MKTFHLGFTGEEVHTLYGVWAFYVLSFFFFFLPQLIFLCQKEKTTTTNFSSFKTFLQEIWKRKLGKINFHQEIWTEAEFSYYVNHCH